MELYFVKLAFLLQTPIHDVHASAKDLRRYDSTSQNVCWPSVLLSMYIILINGNTAKSYCNSFKECLRANCKHGLTDSLVFTTWRMLECLRRVAGFFFDDHRLALLIVSNSLWLLDQLILQQSIMKMFIANFRSFFNFSPTLTLRYERSFLSCVFYMISKTCIYHLF